jgi:hypothetical protein
VPQDADLSGPLGLIDAATPLLVRACVEAGIFTAFGRDERHPDDVAADTGTNPRVVRRAVSALTGRGVFERGDDGRYRLTATGRRLLPDEPGSIAGVATFKPWEFHAWAEVGHTLRTGDAAFAEYYGQPYFEWLADRPEISTHFNRTMRVRTGNLLDAGLSLYDWPGSGTVVDVGGGNGLLLERVLAERPGLRGVVFDLPHVVTEAAERLPAAGFADRVSVTGGDFFDAVPEGGAIYVMASVLHDWPDGDAAAILRTCRRAMTATARLVLFESIRELDTPGLATQLDLHMLVLMGSGERTREEWDELLTSAGFAPARFIPTPGLAWIETRPA